MIAVIAKIPVQPGKSQTFEAAALELEENVTAHEAGCLLYRMTKSREQIDTYMNMELYRDQEALALHQQTPYFHKALEVFKACLSGTPSVEFFDTLV